MLALLPDDYKPDFILRGLFLQRLPIDVRSHLLREKVSDPKALALKADELYQSRVSPYSINLLANDFGKSLQVNLVSSRARTPKIPNSVKIPLSKRFLRLQLQRLDLQLRPVSVGFIRNMVRRPTTAGNPVPFREMSSPAGGYSRTTCRPSCSFSSRGVL